MSGPVSTLMPVSEAYERLLQDIPFSVKGSQQVSLDNACGKVLSKDITAGMAVPAYDNSAMDGFAVCMRDIEAGQMLFPVSQVVAAGHPGSRLEPGTAARIFTGAPVPEGADCVVIQENTRQEQDSIRILRQPSAGENIRRLGHDIEQGSTVLSAGQRLRPQDMGLLSSLGIETVEIHSPLKVALVNTGDEVVQPGQALAAGQIYDSNSYTLHALLTQLRFDVFKCGIVQDDLESTINSLSTAAQHADCIITTGGVSVGDEDHVKAAIEELGEIHLWKLAIKPGKPFSYGAVLGKPVFALPGNPVAVFVTFVLLVRPSLLKMQGSSRIATKPVQVAAGFEVQRTGSRQEYIRVRAGQDQQGAMVLQAFSNQGSSIMTSLSWADGLAVLPVNQTVQRGDMLDYYPFELFN